jgi:hypothetical protein
MDPMLIMSAIGGLASAFGGQGGQSKEQKLYYVP